MQDIRQPKADPQRHGVDSGQGRDPQAVDQDVPVQGPRNESARRPVRLQARSGSTTTEVEEE